jgi:hypothetical protein
MNTNKLAFCSSLGRLAISALIASCALAHTLAARQTGIDLSLADRRG